MYCRELALVTIIRIGNVGALAVFVTYRPYLTGMRILLPGIMFYLASVKLRIKCTDKKYKIQYAETAENEYDPAIIQPLLSTNERKKNRFFSTFAERITI